MLPPASLRHDHAKASSNPFWASQTSSTMTVPISPYTSYYCHQFFSAIYPYHLSAVYLHFRRHGILLFEVAFVERFILRCVASIEHSPASQCGWNTEAVAYFVFFSFCYDCARPIWANAPCHLSSAAPLFVFLYCILERSSINVLSTTFRDLHSHSYIYTKVLLTNALVVWTWTMYSYTTLYHTVFE